MSDTPRTDKQAVGVIGFYSCATVPAGLARELERELNAANAALAQSGPGSGILAAQSPTPPKAEGPSGSIHEWIEPMPSSSASVDSGVEKEKDFAHAEAQPTREVQPEETGIAPCPFCGSPDTQLRRDDVAYLPPAIHVVLCRGCGATGGNVETPEEAAIVWNKRAQGSEARTSQAPSEDVLPANAETIAIEATEEIRRFCIDTIWHGFNVGGERARIEILHILRKAISAATASLLRERDEWQNRYKKLRAAVNGNVAVDLEYIESLEKSNASLLRENQELREELVSAGFHSFEKCPNIPNASAAAHCSRCSPALSGEKNKANELRSETPACRGGKGNENPPA